MSDDEEMAGSSMGKDFPWGEFLAAQRTVGFGASLARIEQNVTKFSGERPGEIPINLWLDRVEKRCDVEALAPEGVVSFLVVGAAREVFETLTVSETKNWSTIKTLLTRSFGQSDRVANDRLRDRRLGAGETVDVYVGELRRCATQVGVPLDSKSFRLQLVCGLPREVEARFIDKPEIFTKDLRDLVDDIRAKVQSFRAESERRKSRGQGSSRELGAQGDPVCYRCQGKGHFAKECPTKQVKRARSSSRARTAPKGGCYICQGGHFAAKCPQRKTTGGSDATATASFVEGAAARGTGQAPETKLAKLAIE